MSSRFEEITSGPIFFPVKEKKCLNWEVLIKRITYRPGYTLDVKYEIDFNTTTLMVRFQTEDTYNRGQMIPILFQAMLPNWDRISDDMEAMRLLRSELHHMEQHESDEWIRLDGEMIFDPHAADRNF